MRWGVLGTGMINDRVLPILRTIPGQTLHGHASRDPAISRAYSDRMGFTRSFESYRALLECNDIDAIYLSTPNAQHFEWLKLAVSNGKHVLVEKPWLTSHAHALEIARLVGSRSGVQVMEGFMYRHHGAFRQAMELIPRLGELRHIRGSFHTLMTRKPNTRLEPETGGGVMWDLGCYLFDFFLSVIPERPVEVSGFKRLLPNGVDWSASGSLRFQSGVCATFDTSFDAPRENRVTIVGSEARLMLERPFKSTDSECLRLEVAGGAVEEIEVRDPVDMFHSEFKAFIAQVNLGKACPLEHPVRVTEALERFLASSR